jgi:hypothetical protein
VGAISITFPIQTPDGYPTEVTLPLVQAAEVASVIRELEVRDHAAPHCHLNECGCCVTIHGRDCAYVIGPDGGSDYFPWRGCACPQ